MKNNAIIRLLKEWDNAKDKKRIELLQDVENETAEFYGRKHRTIKIENKIFESDLVNGRDAGSCFDCQRPYLIILPNLNISADEAIRLVTSIGLNALFYDYRNGKNNVKTIYKFEKDQYLLEHSYLRPIMDYFYELNKTTPGTMSLFDCCFIEENVIHNEESLYMCLKLMQSIESSDDYKKLQSNIFDCFANIMELEQRTQKSEKLVGEKYNDILSIIVNTCNPEKIKTDRKIEQKEEYVDFAKQFTEACLYYRQLYNMMKDESNKSNEMLFLKNAGQLELSIFNMIKNQNQKRK